MLRVLLVDDLPCMRQGWQMRLAQEPGVTIVGAAENGAEALALAKALSPDVALVDVEMPGMDGFAVAKELETLAPSCAVVMLTAYRDCDLQARAQAAGARALVEKGEDGFLLSILHSLDRSVV